MGVTNYLLSAVILQIYFRKWWHMLSLVKRSRHLRSIRRFHDACYCTNKFRAGTVPATGECMWTTTSLKFGIVKQIEERLNKGFFQGPPIAGPPSHKLPIPFPYFKGFLWEWYGSSMGMGVPLLGVPGISLDWSVMKKHFRRSPFLLCEPGFSTVNVALFGRGCVPGNRYVLGNWFHV